MPYLPPGVPDYHLPSDPQDDESSKGILSKFKANPFFPIGIAVGLGGLGFSAYKFKNRGDTKLSLYLIHTRVGVQGAVVGVVTLGVLYSMFNEFILGKEAKK